MGNDLVKDVMSEEVIQTFMASNEKFDVCVIEIFNIDAFLVR
jgi:hypothetical protein